MGFRSAMSPFTEMVVVQVTSSVTLCLDDDVPQKPLRFDDNTKTRDVERCPSRESLWPRSGTGVVGETFHQSCWIMSGD